MTDVVHVPEESRFEVREGDLTAVLVYEVEDGRAALLHTVVPGALEGRGVGSALAERAVAWAVDEGLEVEPVCTFVAGWLARHPEALPGSP
ncbi:MAG TPA: GNAT family N-acetyltransferase [Mycobacteriales bacterium]|nr:GNAT family N-acetyltransferase [Mycobacteriales bacterium]